MALLEDAFKGGNLATGLGVAVGAVVLAPVVLPLVRPLAKGVMKAGLIAYDQGREALSGVNERAGDMIAEVRAEMQESTARRNGGAAAPEEGESARAATARRAARVEARSKPGGGPGQAAPA